MRSFSGHVLVGSELGRFTLMASCGVCQHVCTIPVRAGKGRDKGGDEGLCMMMDIDRYFIMMTSLMGGGQVDMDYEEGMFYRTFFPTASPFCNSRSTDS